MAVLETVLALLAAVLLLLVAVLARRRWLQSAGGTVELSLRLKRPGHGRGWVHGVGYFASNELRWYQVFSLSPRPRRVLSRRDLHVLRRRNPSGAEHLSLLRDAVVMECELDDRPVELAMSLSAVTGFLAWLEAQPPGATLPAWGATAAAPGRSPVRQPRLQ